MLPPPTCQAQQQQQQFDIHSCYNMGWSYSNVFWIHKIVFLPSILVGVFSLSKLVIDARFLDTHKDPIYFFFLSVFICLSNSILHPHFQLESTAIDSRIMGLKRGENLIWICQWVLPAVWNRIIQTLLRKSSLSVLQTEQQQARKCWLIARFCFLWERITENNGQ